MYANPSVTNCIPFEKQIKDYLAVTPFHIPCSQKKPIVARKRTHIALQKFEVCEFSDPSHFSWVQKAIFLWEKERGLYHCKRICQLAIGITNQVWGAALQGLEAVTEKGIWQEEIFEAENENMKKHANSLNASVRSLPAVSTRLSNKKPCSRSSAVIHHSFA